MYNPSYVFIPSNCRMVLKHSQPEACTCGSVKDRIAYNMIRRAEEQGIISPERTTLVGELHSSCVFDWPRGVHGLRNPTVHQPTQPSLLCRWSQPAATLA